MFYFYWIYNPYVHLCKIIELKGKYMTYINNYMYK